MANIICPHCQATIELPKRANGPRGSLAGKAVTEMTIDELKQERRNAKSVLYKATKAGKNPEVIAANQERVDRVLAEIAVREPVPVPVPVPVVVEVPETPVAEEATEIVTEEVVTEEVVTEEVVTEEVAEVVTEEAPIEETPEA